MFNEKYLREDDVLKIIDEVMNNREIDSIRNAILAIRDKVLEVHHAATSNFKWVNNAHWDKNIRGDYSLVCSECGYGLPLTDYMGDHILAYTDCNRVCDEDREGASAIEDLANYCPCCGAYMRQVKEEEAKKISENLDFSPLYINKSERG